MFDKLLFNALEVSLTTGLAICAVMLIARLAEKKFSVRWRYWVWLFIAIRLVIPFNISIPEPPVRFEAPEREVVVTYSQKETKPAETLVFPEEPRERIVSEGTENRSTASEPTILSAQKKQTKTLRLTDALAICWISGTFVSLLWNFGVYALFETRTTLWNRKPGEKAQRIFDGLCRDMGIEGVLLYTNLKIESPMMTGFLKPMVLIPNSEFSEEEYRFILRHELTHYRRHDIWFKLLLLGAKSLHWFNPFIHWMCRQAESDLEIGCDEEVCAAFDREERHRYCTMILESVRRHNGERFLLSTSFYSGKSVLKKRFMSILYPKLKKGLPLIALAIGIVAFCGVLIACEPAEAEPLPEKPLPEEVSEEIPQKGLPVVGEPDENGIYPPILKADFADWVTVDLADYIDESEIPLPEGPATPLLSMPQFVKILQKECPGIDDWEVVYEETFYNLKDSYDPQNYHRGTVYLPKHFAVLKTDESEEFDRVIVCADEYIALDYGETYVQPYREMECSFHTGFESEFLLGDFSDAVAYETRFFTEMGIKFPKTNRFLFFTDRDHFIEIFDYTYSENPYLYASWTLDDYYQGKQEKNGLEERYLMMDLLPDGMDIGAEPFLYDLSTKRVTHFEYPMTDARAISYVHLSGNAYAILHSYYGVYLYDLASETPTKPYAAVLGKDAGKSMRDCTWLTESKTKPGTFATAYTDGTMRELRFMTFTKEGELLSDFSTGLPEAENLGGLSYHDGLLYFSYYSDGDFIHYAVDARADHDHILQKDAW